MIGDEVGALQALTLSFVRQNGLGRHGLLAIIALQTIIFSLVLQKCFGRQGVLTIFAFDQGEDCDGDGRRLQTDRS